MNRGTIKVLIAFCAGQIVQIVCHAAAMNLWEYRQIPFCIAGGFLVAVAIFAGAWVNRGGKEQKPKSYLDWAEEYGREQ